MLPDWAPNIHPLVVHFPIALLFVAVLADALSIFIRRPFASAAFVLYATGVLGLVASFLSGQAAADSVTVSGAANVALTTHADWAKLALWYFGAYAVVRLVLVLKPSWGRHRPVHLVMIALAAGGLFLIQQTADNGGRLVYEYGVGVMEVANLEAALDARERELRAIRGQSELPTLKADGSWSWVPGSDAAEAFDQAFAPFAGSIQVGTHQDSAVGLTVERSPALFVLEQSMQSVQVDVTFGMEDFGGTVQVVTNAVDSLNYSYAAFTGNVVQIGQVIEGKPDVWAEELFVPGRWHDIRVVSDLAHVRVYADGIIIVHGHGDAPEEGSAGLHLDGEGTLLLGSIEAIRLR